MEIALTSPASMSGGSSGSGRGNVFSSSNGLALLASLTLKKALKVEGGDNQLEQQLLQYTDIANNTPLTYQHQLQQQQQHHNHHQQQQQHQLQTQSQQQSVPNSLLGKVLSMDTQMISSSAVTASATAATTTTIDGTKTILTTSSTSTKASATSLTVKGTSSTTNTATNATVQAAAPITTTTTTNNTNKHNFKIPSDILDDLASRFIINVPDMELSNLIRICFQVELAYWFYLDFFCASDEEKKLQPCGIKQFAMQLFQHIPFLREHLSTIDKVLEDWKNYKLSVPTFGGILISEDLNYCLLVQSYFAKSSWGFPKGKVNENEDPEHCAAREVYEETGYDITELIVPNDFIEAVINYQYTRLYIVRNVSLNTQFSPRTRNEIKCCDWFPIDSLPINKNDAISKAKLGINANSFFMIMPFVKRLKKWVNDKRNGNDASAIIAAANAAAATANGGGITTRRKHSNSQSQQSTNAQTINNNNNTNSNKNQSTIATSTSPKSNSPLTTNTTTITGSTGGNNQKYINNSSNVNNNKKNKQQKHNNNNNNDDKNALNGNANNATTNNNCSNSSSNRSKRQRHKSMGDLDGVKLNNLNQQQLQHQQQQSNGKNANNFPTASAAATSTTMVNCNSNNKRNSTKIIAAGSNGNGNGNINNNNNNNNNNCVGTTTKRQLFHSQSQHVIVQQPQGEKIVSSFDLIRKEKQQQLKAAKAQKQQQQQMQQQQQQQLQLQQINNQNGGDANGNVSGRVRAKSQGDKVCISNQQQSLQQQLNKNLNNNKQRTLKQQQQHQPQQTIIIQNSMHKTDEKTSPTTTALTPSSSSSCIKAASAQTVQTTAQTLPSITGADLLAIAAAATASNPTALNAAAFNVVERRQQSQSQQHQLKPRPASVALHYTIATPTAATLGVQRMASGTELRILKRSNSNQHQQQLHQQQQPLKFTPSFNSWTNFSFTKNFITNVFC